MGVNLTCGRVQANKKLELVFVNHTFDVWESWIVEGRHLDNCSLTNSRFRSVSSLPRPKSFLLSAFLGLFRQFSHAALRIKVLGLMFLLYLESLRGIPTFILMCWCLWDVCKMCR
jgi:hypothetical protein